MPLPDEIRETYHAAIQHDTIPLSGEEHLAGVVRRPTGWFRAGVDENYPDLGPPEALLSEVKGAQERLESDMDETAAHNAGWDAVDFPSRYREYLATSSEAGAARETLAERVRAGETVVLVCFEADPKRCHRHLLRDALRSDLDG